MLIFWLRPLWRTFVRDLGLVFHVRQSYGRRPPGKWIERRLGLEEIVSQLDNVQVRFLPTSAIWVLFEYLGGENLFRRVLREYEN